MLDLAHRIAIENRAQSILIECGRLSALDTIITGYDEDADNRAKRFAEFSEATLREKFAEMAASLGYRIEKIEPAKPTIGETVAEYHARRAREI